MKRNLYLLVLPIFLFITSCQKDQCAVPNRTILTELRSGSWMTTNNGRSYIAAIDMPEIDNYFNERGGVLVYASFGNGIYEQIPQVYNGISYSYTTQPGKIEIEIQSSDGEAVITPPGAMTIKIVLIESE